MLLKFDTWSGGRYWPSVVDPTLIAVEMHPGDDSAVVEPSLPEAMTVAIPAVRS